MIMNAKYSKISNGIYPLSVYQTFPADALDIPVALYERFKNGEIYGFDINAKGEVIEKASRPQTPEEVSAKMKNDTRIAIISGITSDALGSMHTYPTTQTDQNNLNGLITESLLPDSGDEYKFWCADSIGVWARRIHTKAQIRVVGKAVLAHVKAQQEIYEQNL